MMDASSIPPELDSRLARLHHEIRDGLARVRRQLLELEQAEGQMPPASSGPERRSAAANGRLREQRTTDFATTLSRILHRQRPGGDL
ncbi:MAG: hypothetical protein AB1505_23890 [Candidatus Latescibacterota bacterium]